MPHKHKRRAQDNTANHYDLPPTSKAKPLPVRDTQKDAKNVQQKGQQKGQQRNTRPSSKSETPAITNYKGDDTPRAFKRLLNLQKTGKPLSHRLDNGDRPAKGKKRKRQTEPEAEAETPVVPTAVEHVTETAPLTIQPGERLGDFAIRVDQALPIAGLSTKGKKVDGVQERRTKHEKKLRKLQDGWRKDEARIKEKEEEEREIAEEELEEQMASLDKDTRQIMMTVGKLGGKGSKKKKGKLIGEIDEKDDDPWAVLKNQRDDSKGIFDVAKAPPKFGKLPREIFKGSKIVDIPKDAGSLRRREQLGQTRQDIIKGYRAMMAAKRDT
ncbi:hypothetical protein BT63DRAFT_481672 [Microthyrium microscopicum]|uniref:Uncharacterized protein n=1 Tax=Microthyrium microscopicum TaxID=703497 RepID=A0A6A6U8L6_9PEZI|nr:hypothetical protein BT63DRAFT_481672 [Microthyrium microscopicum]